MMTPFSNDPNKIRSIRISTTVPLFVHQRLHNRSLQEGRSVSNLCAYILERAMTTDASS